MNSLPPEQVFQRLQELTQGLLYRSESDYPVEAVMFNAATNQELTPEDVLSLVYQPPSSKVEVRDLPHFFRNVPKLIMGEKEDSPTNRYLVLETFLQEQLPDAKVYRIGKRNIQVYVLGKLDDTTYAGVKTTVAQSD